MASGPCAWQNLTTAWAINNYLGRLVTHSEEALGINGLLDSLDSIQFTGVFGQNSATAVHLASKETFTPWATVTTVFCQFLCFYHIGKYDLTKTKLLGSKQE